VLSAATYIIENYVTRDMVETFAIELDMFSLLLWKMTCGMWSWIGVPLGGGVACWHRLNASDVINVYQLTSSDLLTPRDNTIENTNVVPIRNSNEQYVV
jgi:hypothetical protein